MNLYIVTEGKSESIVYRCWIPLINPRLAPISTLDDVVKDHFYIVSGKGFPGYLEIIENAIHDINKFKKFDRLIISVDSEDLSKQEKYDEINIFISSMPCAAEIRIVVQHFCFEAWALGNRRIISPRSVSERLRRYRNFFDVRNCDPELLPSKPDEELNRAQFAEKYLRTVLNEKQKNLTYTKSNPKALLHVKYFHEVKSRFTGTGHIASFGDFLEAFV